MWHASRLARFGFDAAASWVVDFCRWVVTCTTFRLSVVFHSLVAITQCSVKLYNHTLAVFFKWILLFLTTVLCHWERSMRWSVNQPQCLHKKNIKGIYMHSLRWITYILTVAFEVWLHWDISAHAYTHSHTFMYIGDYNHSHLIM